MIRAVIVDDEVPALERFKKILKPYVDFDVVGEAGDGLTALSLIEEKKPDVVFLDIDMPELSGLEVAKTLGVNGPLIIFVTAYDEFALQAFEANAMDYLVKPVSADRFSLTVDKIKKSLSSGKNKNLDLLLSRLQSNKTNPSRLAVKVGVKFEVFDPSTVSALISRDHYTALVLDGRELLSDDSIESLYSRLDPNLFIRVHRGAVVNAKFISHLKREGDRKYTVILNDKNKTELAVSRERLAQLKVFLGLE